MPAKRTIDGIKKESLGLGIWRVVSDSYEKGGSTGIVGRCPMSINIVGDNYYG